MAKQEYLDKGIDGLIWKDKAKETPLHIAAKFNQLDIVKQYLQYDYKDENGETALHEAAKHGHINIVEYLLNNNAGQLKTIEGKLPLHMASKYCFEEISSADTLSCKCG